MFFSRKKSESIYVARSDEENLLSSASPHPFFLDEADWPTVEHYYQAMKFTDGERQSQVRDAPSPADAKQIAGDNKKAIREDWKKVKVVMMTRAVYTQARTHGTISKALLKTGEKDLIETSQYDYFWGCGRDGKGGNHYGKVLMAVREKLLEELDP